MAGRSFEPDEFEMRPNNNTSFTSPSRLGSQLQDGDIEPLNLERDISEQPIRSAAAPSLAQENRTEAQSGGPAVFNSGRGRRVQWTFGDGSPPHRPYDAHTALNMPQGTPEDTRSHGDYFSGASSSDTTPEWSSLNTPDFSRPPSPGDPDVDIAEGERDGLPQLHTSARKFNRQASKLIGLHRAKEAFMSGKKSSNRHESEGVDPEQLREALARSALLQDQEGNGLRSTKPVAGTSGVLSSLLRLYDHPQQPSASSSQATLINGGLNSETPESTRRPATPLLDLGGAFREAGGAIRKTKDKVAHSISDYDRPTAARSGGGVFAALQAGALDLAGVASPIASTVKPNAERPGHGVSRFTLEPPPEKDSPPSSSRLTPPSARALPTGAVTPAEGGKGSLSSSRNRSNLSLSGLTEIFDPQRYHSESHVTRHYKSSQSGATTPAHEVPSYEKVMTEKPSGLVQRKKKDKHKREEIYITMHVAAILQRQDFILRLARALMMFGAPSHRFESQLQRTARVLDIDVQVIYLMGFMILAFQDPDTHTSEIKIVKQGAGLNLHKLKSLAVLHWEVMHDKIGVQDASTEISRLMTAKPTWNKWWSVFLGGFCSSFIGAASFNASFIDALMAYPLGCAVIATQVFVASKSEILSNAFEIFITAIASFIAAALQSSGQFCYASVISSTIVLILPGWLVCCAALELQSRNIVTGSVRLIWAIIYSLFLGFGISIGATIWNGVAPNRLMLPDDITCGTAHGQNPPWWRMTVPKWWAFLLVPGYSTCLSLKNQAKIRTKEFPAMVLLACVGWTINYFSSRAFPGRSDINSALGALAVSFCANMWGKFFQGTSFIVAVTPIMFQLPSGLGANGLLSFANTSNNSVVAFGNGLQVAQQLLTVSIGLVAGIISGSVLVYPFSSKRVKDIMSF